MKHSRFWLSALTAALLIGWSCFHWGSSAAQAQQAVVNDAFTIAAEQCLTASSPQAALAACDRAIGINDEDPIPWYGKAEAHKSLNQNRQTQIALVQFDFIGRYYGAMLQTVQGLQRRLIIKDLVDNDEQVVALQNQVRQSQTVINNPSASQDERNEARARVERLSAIQDIYNEAKANPQLLDDWLNNTTEAMIGLRKDFVAARARLAAEQ